jgi:hypothetical protein
MFYRSSISSDFVINIQTSFILVLTDSLIFLPFLLDTFQKIFFISHIYFFIHVSSFRIVFPYFVKLHSITRTVLPLPTPPPFSAMIRIFFHIPNFSMLQTWIKKKTYTINLNVDGYCHMHRDSIFILIFRFLLSLKWAKNLLQSLLCQMVFVVQQIMLSLYTFIKLIWNMYYQKVYKTTM